MIWTSLIAQNKRQLLMSFLVATLISIIYFYFFEFYQESSSSWFFLMGWIPVGLYWVWTFLNLLYRLDQQPFRVLDLGIASDQTAPGQSFALKICLETRRSTQLVFLKTQLRCTHSRATSSGTTKEVIHEYEQTLEENAFIVPKEARTYHANFPVSIDAPYSFRSMEGKISWTIRVALVVDGWDDIHDELEVTVVPGITG